MQIDVYRAVIKRLSFRASAHTGVGIPFEFADSYLKSEEIATPACGLVRNDVVIWWLAASTQQNYKLKFTSQKM